MSADDYDGPQTRSKTALEIASGNRDADENLEALRNITDALRQLAARPLPPTQTSGELLDVRKFSGREKDYTVSDFIERFTLVTRAFEFTDKKRA